MQPRKKVSQGYPAQFGLVLRPFFQKTGLVARIRENRLKEAWEDIVGKAVAEASEPGRLQDRILQVKVFHPIWMQQLQFHKRLILDKVNEFLGGSSVRDLRFFLGEKTGAGMARKKREMIPIRQLSREEEEKIERVVESVRDGEMKELLFRLFARAWALQRAKRGDESGEGGS